MLQRSVVRAGLLAGALVALAACQATSMRDVADRAREMNPFKPRAEAPPAPPAPIRSGETTGTPPPATAPRPAPAAPARTAVTYQVPKGGPNTISLTVSGCLENCPRVNVMLDPDNYWQRSAPEGTSSGKASDGLYNIVASAFQAQGFYAFQGTIDVIGGNDAMCPDYAPGGQVFFVSLTRNSANRVVNFDTGCIGTASADGAAAAINTLIQNTEYMNIVSGTAK